MVIQPIVEGSGDVCAIPVLLRRICHEMFDLYDVRVAAPMRVARSKMVQESEMRKYLRIAASQAHCDLILLFMDADDDCPKQVSEMIQTWIAQENIGPRCEVVVISREYEGWFIAALESLRGVRGIRDDASSHKTPDLVRNPKGVLTHWMEGTSAYHEAADQAALTALVDLTVVRQKCRAFHRLVGKIAASI